MEFHCKSRLKLKEFYLWFVKNNLEMVKKYLQVFTLEMTVKTPISYISIKDDIGNKNTRNYIFCRSTESVKKFCLFFTEKLFLICLFDIIIKLKISEKERLLNFVKILSETYI